MTITSMDQINQLPDNKTIRAIITFDDGSTASRRVLKGDNEFAVYARRSRRRGHWYSSFKNGIVAIEPIAESVVDDATKWQKSWTRVLRMLETSGLWSELKDDIAIGLSIGYDKVKQAYDTYWECKSNDEKVEVIRKIDERLIAKTPEGTEYVCTHIVWDMCNPAKVKKMYFGKYDNGRHLGYIADAMANKTPYESGRIIAGYDITFEYNPTKNKAWYSEEYRGCGNGHYYLAINETHALFSEDD